MCGGRGGEQARTGSGGLGVVYREKRLKERGGWGRSVKVTGSSVGMCS